MTELDELDGNSVPDEEIPAEEEDRPDFPDDGEGIITLTLTPTAHVLFTLSLRSEGIELCVCTSFSHKDSRTQLFRAPVLSHSADFAAMAPPAGEDILHSGAETSHGK
jgi:hypothetical protein